MEIVKMVLVVFLFIIITKVLMAVMNKAGHSLGFDEAFKKLTQRKKK